VCVCVCVCVCVLMALTAQSAGVLMHLLNVQKEKCARTRLVIT
jgi:hypothetical protein